VEEEGSTVTISARIPAGMLEEVRLAMKVVHAVSVSDFIRIALREYLKLLSNQLVEASKKNV
jgi:Arc/MetJ-type ribon-helix-helix transcriptional regulator